MITYTPPNVPQFQSTTESFTVTVTDALGASGSGVVTFKVVAGDQTTAPITMQLNPKSGSQLFIPLCGNPPAAAYSNDGGATCPTISMSSLFLNGQAQTSTGPIGTVTVVDARGLYLGWGLTAQVTDFVNQNPKGPLDGSGNPQRNDVIPASNLSLTVPATGCQVSSGGIYSAVTNGSGGSFNGTPVSICSSGAGASGGTFTADANLALNVNPDQFAGTYAAVLTYQLS